VEQRVLVTVKDAICFRNTSGEILASQTSHSSIEKRRLDAQAEPPPTAIQIALRRRSIQVDRIHTIEARPSRSALTGDIRGGPNSMCALSMSSIRYCEVARWLSAFRTYSSRSNS
jgi:hypothetical protein